MWGIQLISYRYKNTRQLTHVKSISLSLGSNWIRMWTWVIFRAGMVFCWEGLSCNISQDICVILLYKEVLWWKYMYKIQGFELCHGFQRGSSCEWPLCINIFMLRRSSYLFTYNCSQLFVMYTKYIPFLYYIQVSVFFSSKNHRISDHNKYWFSPEIWNFSCDIFGWFCYFSFASFAGLYKKTSCELKSYRTWEGISWWAFPPGFARIPPPIMLAMGISVKYSREQCKTPVK